MADNEDVFSSGRPDNRKLSDFLCEEMLYDHLTGNLDSSRSAAVLSHLNDSPEIHKKMLLLQGSIEYTEELSKTQLSEPLKDWIMDGGNNWARRLLSFSWKNWPEFMRWSTEAVLISLTVALVAIFVPWNKVNQILPGGNKVVLVEVESPEQEASESGGHQKEEDSADLKVEQAANEEVKTAVSEPKENPPDKEGSSAESEPVSPAAKKEAEVIASEEQTVVAKAVVPKKLSYEERLAQEYSSTFKPSFKGLLFRAFMEQEHIDVSTPKMIGLITRLGGERAGKVSLGWKKPNGRYFHFTIPESNREKLLQGLKSFGPVRLYKNPHWRVMPKGKLRFILWVEDVDYNRPSN